MPTRATQPRPQSDGAIEWLLAGDPSIRWQTLQDLIGSNAATVERERRKVAREGWGARLLASQNADGRWAGGRRPDAGLYSPKWISTTYTLLMLRDFGLQANNRQARRGCTWLIDEGLQPDGGINYGDWAKWTGTSETCVTGMVLSLLSYFEHDDERLQTVVQHLLERQMPDGGWNCRLPRGATHASVHTTINVLEGLYFYERLGGRAVRAVKTAQRRGREFLLEHRLFRSHRTGEIMKPLFVRFSYPPRWHYDILRALDYFRAVGAPRDPRLSDAIDIVRRTRQADGRWLLHHAYKGRTYFQLERVGSASRWNTLRAMRVLKWWEGRGPGGDS
jgi:hypothetical protein